MAKTLKIIDWADNLTNIFDNTPTDEQLLDLVNQAVTKINEDALISLPHVFDKQSEKPDYISQEDWDSFADSNDVYPLDDQWIRSLFFYYIGYRMLYIEEGADAPETYEAMMNYTNAMRSFKTQLPYAIEETFRKKSGLVEKDNGQGNIGFLDTSSNPYGGNF